MWLVVIIGFMLIAKSTQELSCWRAAKTRRQPQWFRGIHDEVLFGKGIAHWQGVYLVLTVSRLAGQLALVQ